MQCRRNIAKKHLYNDKEKCCSNVNYALSRQLDSGKKGRGSACEYFFEKLKVT